MSNVTLYRNSLHINIAYDGGELPVAASKHIFDSLYKTLGNSKAKKKMNY